MVCQCVTFMTLLKWDHLTLWGSCIHFFFALFFFLFCFVFVCFCLFFVFVWSRIYPWCEFFLNVTKMHKTYILILQFSTRNVGQIEVEFPIYYVKKNDFRCAWKNSGHGSFFGCYHYCCWLYLPPVGLPLTFQIFEYVHVLRRLPVNRI